jgi:hypothetical protein
MEKFSEILPKRKRGRPLIFGERAYQNMSWLSPNNRTQRGRSNQNWLNYALNLLKQDHPDRERYRWLWPTLDFPYGAGVKITLLVEVGRIRYAYGAEAARQVALQLCETKPKTQEGVRSLRAWRLQREAQAGDVDGLYDALVRAIEAYLDRLPATPEETIGKALTALLWRWEDVREERTAEGVAGAAIEGQDVRQCPQQKG